MPQLHDEELKQIENLIQNGEWSAALESCRDRLNRDPQCIAAHRHGLTAAWCLGRFDLAVSFADGVLNHHPFDVSVLTTKGLLCLVTGDLEQSRGALSTALSFAEQPTQKELARKTLALVNDLLAVRTQNSGFAVVELTEAEALDRLSA